jgi:hypothetical protein
MPADLLDLSGKDALITGGSRGWADEAAEWMVIAAKTRPVRTAARIAVTARALDLLAPSSLTSAMRRRYLTLRPDEGIVPVD